jgi:hypothetical protein
MRHEAVERREAANAHHQDVAALAGADAQVRQACGTAALGFELGALQQQGPQFPAAMGTDETHRLAPGIVTAFKLCTSAGSALGAGWEEDATSMVISLRPRLRLRLQAQGMVIATPATSAS